VLREAEASLQREDATAKALASRVQELEAQAVGARLAVAAAQSESLKLTAVLRNYEIRFPHAFREPGEAVRASAHGASGCWADRAMWWGRAPA
jgi:hypothetical protein